MEPFRGGIIAWRERPNGLVIAQFQRDGGAKRKIINRDLARIGQR